jgi:hypothetical protein
MPFKLVMGGSTESYLRDSSHIPQHGGRYKVITNASVLDTVRAELAAAGLIVDRELFSSNGKVTVGNHYMSYGTDPNIGIVFTWVNSYDKSTKFHCSVGLHFKDTDGVMITSDMAFFMRKHTGTADIEMVDNVKKQIGHTDSFYNELLRRKIALGKVLINKDQCGEIMGKTFMNDYLKADQLTTSKHYYDKLFVKSDEISLWDAYVGLAYSIQHSHPKFYTRSHIGCFDVVYNEMVHTIISNTVTPQEAFPVNIIDTDPNQINIFDVIAEEEQLHVDTTNDLLIPEFNNVENTGSDFDIDKENEPVNEPVIFDFEEEEEPVDTTPVPDAFYEDQEKEENVLSDAEEFFNFDNDILDLPEL